MIWLYVVIPCLLLGLLRLPWWTALVGPAICLALGAYLVAIEPANYDMPNFGYFVGAVAAVVSLLAWLLGRGVAELVSRRG